MQHYYDGQIRRYLSQIIRLLSNFVVKYGDGTLVKVPVMYGDPDRQVANILNQNSENVTPSVPRMAVYITEFDLNRSRIQEPTFISKMHVRERAIETDSSGNEFYTSEQGKQYSIERMMPTPFDLTVKVDIWTSNTDQKLQILEQILVLFNPSLEIQTTDNFIDWTSLSVVELEDVNFSSRSVPTGTNSSIDIASLTLKTPAWLSPPVKVKKLGVVTRVINSVFSNIAPGIGNYIEGLGYDNADNEVGMSNLEFTQTTSIGNFEITVEFDNIKMFSKVKGESSALNWLVLLKQMPGQFTSGLSKIFLLQEIGSYVVGTLSLNPLDLTKLSVIWDTDTFNSNNYIDNFGKIGQIDQGFDATTGKGTFDAIVSPLSFNPKRPNNENIDQIVQANLRYLLVDNLGGGVRETFKTNRPTKVINTGEDFDKVNDSKVIVDGVFVVHSIDNVAGKCHIEVSSIIPKNSTVTYILNFNEDGPDAWKNSDGTDAIAYANDIVMWTGSEWRVIFDAQIRSDTIIYQTNYYTNTQYKWNGVSWVKSFEGDYDRGSWRLQLQ